MLGASLKVKIRNEVIHDWTEVADVARRLNKVKFTKVSNTFIFQIQIGLDSPDGKGREPHGEKNLSTLHLPTFT